MFAVEYAQVENPQVWPWIRYTPAITRSGTALDTETCVVDARYRLVGDTLEVAWRLSGTGFGSGDIEIPLPNGFEIDPDKLDSTGHVDHERTRLAHGIGAESSGYAFVDSIVSVVGTSNTAWAPEEGEEESYYLQGFFHVPVKDPYRVQ